MVRTLCTSIAVNIWQQVTSQKLDTKTDKNPNKLPILPICYHFVCPIAGIGLVSTHSYLFLSYPFVGNWHSLRSLRSDLKLSKWIWSCLPRQMQKIAYSYCRLQTASQLGLIVIDSHYKPFEFHNLIECWHFHPPMGNLFKYYSY